MQSVLLGVALGIVYDFLRSIRLTFHTGWIRNLLLDIFFWLLAAGAFGIFVLTAARGNCRFYLLMGMGMGMLLYVLTISIIFQKLFGGFFLIFYKGMKKIKKFFQIIANLFGKIKFHKKDIKFSKKDFKFFGKRFKIK